MLFYILLILLLFTFLKRYNEKLGEVPVQVVSSSTNDQNMDNFAELSFTGNVYKNWREWKQEFFVYLNGYRQYNEATQVDLFLNVIGEEARNKLDSFNLSLNDRQQLTKIIQAYDDYFAQSRNQILNRHNFFRRFQQNGESLDNFVTELEKMSRCCGFGYQRNNLIRDQIICGIKNEPLRRNLLEYNRLTLEECINICKVVPQQNVEPNSQMRWANRRKAKIEHMANRDSVNGNDEVKDQNEKPVCGNCGFTHGYRRCPAYGKFCRKCQRNNHFYRMCKNVPEPEKQPELKKNITEDKVEDTLSNEAEDKYNEGQRLFEKGQFANAIRLLNDAVFLSPDNAQYRCSRSACFINLNKYTEGLKDAIKCVELDKTYTEGYRLIAQCDLIKNDFNCARIALRSALEYSSPENPTIGRLRAELKNVDDIIELDKLMKYNLTIKNYNVALDISKTCCCKVPESEIFLLYQAECFHKLGDVKTAKGLIASLKDFNVDKFDDDIKSFDCFKVNDKPSEEAEKKNDDAKRLFELKQYDNAIKLYTEAIELCPSVAKYWGNRSACYIMMEKYNEALTDSRKSVDLEKTYIKGYIRIAKINCIMHELKLAESILNEGLDLNPESKDIAKELKDLINLTMWHEAIKNNFKLKKFNETLKLVEKCLKQVPESKVFILYKAECFYNIGKETQAKEIVTKVNNSDFNREDFGDIFTTFKCFDFKPEMSEERKKAEKKNTDANELFRLGKYENALFLYSEAVELCPNVAKYFGNRSACLLMLERIDKALRDAKTSIELDKNYMKGYVRVAHCNITMNNIKSAQAILKKAANIDPLNLGIKYETDLLNDMIQSDQRMKNNFNKKMYSEALDIIKKHIEDKSKSKYYMLYKAECFYHLGNIVQAENIMKQINGVNFDSDEIFFDKKIKTFQVLDIHKMKDSKRIIAERKNDQGNISFNLKHYSNALYFYADAISIFPSEAKYWGNRSACYMMLENYPKALKDAYKSIELDKNFTKSYIRIAKCSKQIGDLKSAKNALENAIRLAPSDANLKKDLTEINLLIKYENEVEENLENNDCEKAIESVEKLLKILPNNKKYTVKKAECYVKQEKYETAIIIVSEVLNTNPNDEEALYFKAFIFYYQHEIKVSFECLKEIMKKMPDHLRMGELFKKAKSIIAKISNADDSLNPVHTYKHLTDAILIDPTNKVTNKRLYLRKLKLGLECTSLSATVIQDCFDFFDQFGQDLQVLKIRAKCFMVEKEYEDARDDYEEICKLENTAENKNLFAVADKMFGSELRDNYKILRVEKTATKEEIKKSYSVLLKRYHTDKHNNAPQVMKDKMNKKFIRVRKAYENVMKEKDNEGKK